MNVQKSIAAPLIAAAVAAAMLASTFAVSGYMQRSFVPAMPGRQLDAPLVAVGHKLFLMNCAHCHADDATGDEGPDLHGLHKSDERLRLLIRNGIKGEMPRFNEKLADKDLNALVAFLDSMR